MNLCSWDVNSNLPHHLCSLPTGRNTAGSSCCTADTASAASQQHPEHLTVTSCPRLLHAQLCFFPSWVRESLCHPQASRCSRSVLTGVSLQVSGQLSSDDAISTSSISVQPAYGLQPPVPFQQPGPPQLMPHPDMPGDGGGDATLTHNPVYR